MIKKETWWLICIAVTSVAYLYVFEFDRTDQPESMPGFFQPFKADEIVAIQITYNGTNTVRTVRTSERWMLETPINYPAIAEGPNAMLQELTKLKPLS